MMYLLKRAHEIYQNPDSMKTQELAETKGSYESGRKGDIEAFLSKHCDNAPDDVGVLYTWALETARRETGSNMSKRRFDEALQAMGLEKQTRTRCKAAVDGSVSTYTLCDYADPLLAGQKTLIMGLSAKMRSRLD